MEVAIQFKGVFLWKEEGTNCITTLYHHHRKLGKAAIGQAWPSFARLPVQPRACQSMLYAHVPHACILHAGCVPAQLALKMGSPRTSCQSTWEHLSHL